MTTRARRLTASQLWRAFICIGSVVLEQDRETNEWSERGTGLHDFLLDVPSVGREAALAKIKDEDLRAACALLNLARLPVDPALYAAEVAFAYDVTGRARELGRAINRDYSTCTPSEIAGTADVVALIGTDTVYVGDYKSGWKYLGDPETNWQFKFLALAAARTYKRSRVIVEMIRLGKDGNPFKIGGELNLFDLAETAEQLRELHADATRWAAADEDPPVVTGSHCEGCESIAHCKPATAIMRAAAANPEAHLAGLAEQLTEEHALVALGQVDVLEALVKKLRKQVNDYSTVNPIRLPDGRVYTVREAKRSHPEGLGVFHFWADQVGAEEAWKTVKITSTWKDVDDHARGVAHETGRKIKHVVDEMHADLENRGAVKTSHHDEWRAVKPPKELKGS